MTNVGTSNSESQEEPEWNTAVIRKQLTNAFDDIGFDSFCMDNFPQVYDRFSRGLIREEKINLLLNHCRRRLGERDRLERLVRAAEVIPDPSMDRFQKILMSELIAIISIVLAIWIASLQIIVPLTATCDAILLRAVPLVILFSASGSFLTSFVARHIGGTASSSFAFCVTRSRRDHIEAAIAGLLLLVAAWIFIVLIL
jgi:hypothetical protein